LTRVGFEFRQEIFERLLYAHLSEERLLIEFERFHHERHDSLSQIVSLLFELGVFEAQTLTFLRQRPAPLFEHSYSICGRSIPLCQFLLTFHALAPD
jgi:hypothetical protein